MCPVEDTAALERDFPRRLAELYEAQLLRPDAACDALRRVVETDSEHRAALEAADFQSVRGDFKFAPNHHPIQTIYMREVVKEGDVVTNKVIGVAAKDHTDVYGADCKM